MKLLVYIVYRYDYIHRIISVPLKWDELNN